MWAYWRDLYDRFKTRRELRKKGALNSRQYFDWEHFGEMLDRSPAPGIFTLIMVWAVSSVLLTLASQQQFADSRNLIAGQEAPRNLMARFEFTAPDYVRIGEAAKKAEREQPDIFQVSNQLNRGIKANFTAFFSSTASTDPEGISPELLTPALRKLIAELRKHPDGLYDAFLKRLDEVLQRGILANDDKSSRKLGKLVVVIDASNRRREAKPVSEVPDAEQAGAQLAATALSSYPEGGNKGELTRQLALVCAQLIGHQGNLVFSSTATRQELATALKNLPVPTVTVGKGDLLVRRGEEITHPVQQLIAEYTRQERERMSTEEELGWFLRNMVWAFVLVTFAGFYLYHLHPDVVHSNKRLALIGLLTILSLLINYGVIRFFYFLVSESRYLPHDFALNLMPIALVAVTLAAVFGYRVALCAGFFVASITAMMLVPERAFDQAIKGMVICSLAALAVRSATNYRSYFVRIVGSVFPLVLILNLNLLKPDTPDTVTEGITYLILALSSAVITGILALLLIFLCELVFNVSTNMALMVLCDYNHPLLERLKREAPGTFFHSLMVATLVEDAARAIGANPLKAKTGALFHDIGKLSMPQYFTENNLDSANQHIRLNPQMSSIIIRDHVKEGLALARQYHMCRTVRDAIVQHHGNDLVHYFYAKALTDKRDGAPVLESQYRYNGIPPTDKEMAIISLADACEAASRSLDKPSASKIEALVNDIFLRRYQDGQLNRANITLAELDKVRQSFINTIISMKHGRIAYQREPARNDGNDLFVGNQTVPPTETK